MAFLTKVTLRGQTFGATADISIRVEHGGLHKGEGDIVAHSIATIIASIFRGTPHALNTVPLEFFVADEPDKVTWVA